MNDNDSFLTTISDRQTHIDTSQIKFISPTKWQKFMIDTLKLMINKNGKKKNLITDLITIVSTISQHNFVEATLQIRPFKPQFQQILPVFMVATQSTMAETVTKNVKYHDNIKKIEKQNNKKHKVTQKTLTKQFAKDYHPFKFIIKNFKRLLELKFKNLIDFKKITNFEKLFNELRQDMSIFNQFMHAACQPYRKLFKNTRLSKAEGDENQNTKFEQFIDAFLSDNENLNKCIHKIIVYASRTFYKQIIQEKIKDYPNVEDFGMPQQFRIDGCYIRTINSLMQMSEGFSEQKILRKLMQYRQNILIDISQFYKDRHLQSKQLQVNAEVQIQIIRYTLSKLKGWACEIFAQLKFLQYLEGQQMHYKFQQSSYVYSQLCMAFEVLDLDGENPQSPNEENQNQSSN